MAAALCASLQPGQQGGAASIGGGGGGGSCAAGARAVGAAVAAVPDPLGLERLLEALLRHLGGGGGAAGGAPSPDAAAAEAALAAAVPAATWEARPEVRHLLGEALLTRRVLPPAALRLLLRLLRSIDRATVPAASSQEREGGGGGGELSGGGIVAGAAARVALVWADVDATRQLSVPQQAYLTAALVQSLEMLGKGGLERHPSLLPTLLRGVTARLDSPTPVRLFPHPPPLGFRV